MAAAARILVGAAILAAAVAAAACGGEPAAQAPQPTKAALVALLGDVQAAIARGDLDAAAAAMVELPGEDPQAVKEALPIVSEREGLVPETIASLAERGTFAPLLELYPDAGKQWAEKAGVDPTQCYALGVGAAQVAGHWDGRRFRLIWVNDLYRLR